MGKNQTYDASSISVQEDCWERFMKNWGSASEDTIKY